jgi:hypothetical protein
MQPQSSYHLVSGLISGREKPRRLGLILRLTEEATPGKATIADFFLACAPSSTDNIQANLNDWNRRRRKKETETKPLARLGLADR